MNEPLDLVALRVLTEKAITPDEADDGTWELERRRRQFGILRNYGVDRFGAMWHAYVLHDAGAEDDAAFIAAANPATVLALIDEVERLRAAEARVRAIHEPRRDPGYSLVTHAYCSAGEMVVHVDDDGCRGIGPTNYPCATLEALDGTLVP